MVQQSSHRAGMGDRPVDEYDFLERVLEIQETEGMAATIDPALVRRLTVDAVRSFAMTAVMELATYRRLNAERNNGHG